MSRGLEALEELKKETRKGGQHYIVKSEKRRLHDIIEKELKERQYLYHLLDALFEECEVGSSAEYDEDLRKYVVEFQIDGKYKFHIYCDHKEYLFWREKSGFDDQYGPEDLR